MGFKQLNIDLHDAFRRVKTDVRLLVIWNFVLTIGVLYLLWVKFP